VNVRLIFCRSARLHVTSNYRVIMSILVDMLGKLSAFFIFLWWRAFLEASTKCLKPLQPRNSYMSLPPLRKRFKILLAGLNARAEVPQQNLPANAHPSVKGPAEEVVHEPCILAAARPKQKRNRGRRAMYLTY